MHLPLRGKSMSWRAMVTKASPHRRSSHLPTGLDLLWREARPQKIGMSSLGTGQETSPPSLGARETKGVPVMGKWW